MPFKPSTTSCNSTAPASKTFSSASPKSFSYCVGSALRVCQMKFSVSPGFSITPLPATLFGCGASHGFRKGLKFTATSRMSFHLDLDFFTGEAHRIRLQVAATGLFQALARRNVKHGFVQRAFDRVAVDKALRQQRVCMRTDVFERIERIAHLVDADFRAVELELERRVVG